MIRKQWAVLLAAGLMFVLAACGPAAAPADPSPSPEQPSVGEQAVEPGAADPPAECTSVEPAVADGEKLVTVYFACGDPNDWPTVPVAVQRAVPADKDDLTAVLEALLAGPTEAERAAAFRSWFSETTADRLNGATLDSEGHAVVNFKTFSHLIPNAGTSAGSEWLMAEIGSTIAQFEEVKTFELQFDGSCNLFGEWLQSGCYTRDADDYR